MKLPPLALVAPSLCPRCDQPAMLIVDQGEDGGHDDISSESEHKASAEVGNVGSVRLVIRMSRS